MDTFNYKLNSPHVLGQIYYLSISEGGRKTPIYSGYRGQFHIYSSDWDASQEFIDKPFCNPGESVKAYMKFATVHEIIYMEEGLNFQIREGNKIVGQGVITTILDKSIQQSSSKRNLYKSIDEIAWNYWDPIGVNSYEEARDEYYSYLPKIFSMILENASVEFIANYLYKIEKDYMGLIGNYEKCLQTTYKFLVANKNTQNGG